MEEGDEEEFQELKGGELFQGTFYKVGIFGGRSYGIFFLIDSSDENNLILFFFRNTFCGVFSPTNLSFSKEKGNCFRRI
ncbi:MAG TPA: hypothetical protein VFM18_07160, partial [Methanosarcina sp.]|nr:hypothetical protein [Methanosarcina sp.]